MDIIVDQLFGWKNNKWLFFALPKLSREIMAGGNALQQAEVKLEGLVLLVELRCDLTYCISSVKRIGFYMLPFYAICIIPCLKY